jgi:transposase-like protein
MFLVAFGFFESESKDSWTWFMKQLRKAIGEPPLLAICSSACKGLTRSVKDVFPDVEQRECFKHLMQNYTKQFAGQQHMYLAARAYRTEVYDRHMVNVAGIDGVSQWIKE